MNRLDRIRALRVLLSSLGLTGVGRPYNSLLSSNIFELYCYMKKLNEFQASGKSPIMVSISGNPHVFRPHLSPGTPRNADYFQLIGNRASENRDLILNGQFEGISGIYHSPDIVLTEQNDNQVITFYECKHYSGRLTPNVYREFIGYCKEMGITISKSGSRYSAFANTFSVMTPCLFTSACARSDHKDSLREAYNLEIRDRY